MPLRLILTRQTGSDEMLLSLGLDGESLQSLAAKAGFTLGGLCGGIGRCTTCKIIVRDGIEHLCRLSREEKEFHSKGILSTNERLACQCTITNPESTIAFEYQDF